MNKGRARSEAFGLVSASGSALGRKAPGKNIRAVVGACTVKIVVVVDVGAVIAVRARYEQSVRACIGRNVGLG